MMKINKKKAVFLDRDGVINIEKNIVTRWEEFQFVPGIIENIKRLNRAGFLVIIITNQSGINKGLYSEETLQQIHEKMQKIIEHQGARIDDIFYCPHYVDDDCDCRKPKPGMILTAAKKHNIDLNHSWMIGDSKRDIEAGKQAGCRVILIEKNVNIQPIVDQIIFSSSND